MIRHTLRAVAITVISMSFGLFAAIAVVGLSGLAEAGPIPPPQQCGRPYYALQNPCSNGQVGCPNPTDTCELTKQNVGGVVSYTCVCVPFVPNPLGPY